MYVLMDHRGTCEAEILCDLPSTLPSTTLSCGIGYLVQITVRQDEKLFIARA